MTRDDVVAPGLDVAGRPADADLEGGRQCGMIDFDRDGRRAIGVERDDGERSAWSE